jgi:hypothetical protein
MKELLAKARPVRDALGDEFVEAHRRFREKHGTRKPAKKRSANS